MREINENRQEKKRYQKQQKKRNAQMQTTGKSTKTNQK